MGRRLGQHFLKAPSVERLLRLVSPAPDDDFLEVGPGRGALTLPLATRAGRVVAVELDGGLAAHLRSRAPANLTVVEGDALQTDLSRLIQPPARLVGNLPYYVSSPLLRHFFRHRAAFRDAHLMLQEEVASRVAAPPGSREYGVLSVLLGLWADLDVPLRFPPGSFQPPPRVGSALLRIRFLEKPRAEVAGGFEDLVHRAFAHRRKTLANNLQDSYPNLKEYLRLCHIEGSRRPETLSVADFARLSCVVAAG
jgi:16S rRNA (adenine1518-N6/adenine1519-N6)-dimethyltransferase